MDTVTQDEIRLNDPTLSKWNRIKLQGMSLLRYLYGNLVVVLIVTLIAMGFLLIVLWSRWQTEYIYIEKLLGGGP